MSVHCLSCGFENAPTHKFCAECGTSLDTRACPACGTDVNPDHKFCPDCGESLADDGGASSPPAPVAERRLVTSLFCDLVGFTAFSEARDPEEIRSVLTDYFQRAQAVVLRFGGVIDKYTGDAITVFWGATTAQADDAERAVRAGLELVDTVAQLGEDIGVPELQLRVGILTGETAVGPGGNETGLVLGDVVNTAARLQAIADPGTVAVGDSTKGMTEAAILYEDVGWHELKGKGQPVRVWRPTSVISARGGRRRSTTLEPLFVGRTYELRLLKELLHVTGAERRARLVAAVGEAGIGKSRLTWEFQKYVDGLVEDVYWHQGRSPAYTEGPTAWSLGEMVRSRAGIGELDDPIKAYTRLRTAVAEYVSDPEERRWIEPRLAGLLGLDEMPGGDRNELYAAIRTFFERIAERGTVVLVFEDTHWADDGVVAFIEELIDRSRRHPILVLTLARPDIGEVAETLGRGRPNLTSLHLGPIAESAMRQLVEHTAPDLGSGLVDQIVERAAGVPLYAVEMLRMLVADGTLAPVGDGTYAVSGDVASIAVPDSLQSVIGARIDQLPADLRALVKHASVLGHSFALESLGVVTGGDTEALAPQVARLVEAEVLRLDEEPRSPERGQYKFVQGLIREVAYGRLTIVERKQGHLAVADHFERIGDVEVAAVVASHLLDAHRVDPAAPDAQDLAVRGREALVRAAQRAADLHSHRQVLKLAEMAAELAIERSSKAEMDLLRAGAARGLGDYEQAIEAARSAAVAFAEESDQSGRLRAVTLAGTCLAESSFPLDAIDEMAESATQDDPAESLDELRLHEALARAHMLAGNGPESLHLVEAALPMAEHLKAIDVLAELLITKAAVFAFVGRQQEAMVVLRGVLQLAESRGLVASIFRASNNLCVALLTDDELAVDAVTRESWERATAVGDPVWMFRIGFDLANSAENSGRFEEVRAIEAQLGDRLPAFVRKRFEFLWAFTRYTRGEIDFEETVSTLSHVKALRDPQLMTLVMGLEARLHLLGGDFEQAWSAGLATPHAYGYPLQLETALLAAIWSDHAGFVSEAAERIATFDRPGRMVDALKDLAVAAVAHQEGRHDEATTLCRRVVSEVSATFRPLRRAIVVVTVARLLGIEHPLGAEAAEAAHRIFTDQGRTRLLTVFAEALPKTDVQVAAG